MTPSPTAPFTLMTSSGLHTILARVLHGNTPMRHLLERTGSPNHVEHGPDADNLRLTI